MNTTKKTLLTFWRANNQHPWLFYGTVMAWLVGLTLQKIVVPLIAAQAINKLIAIHNQVNVNYWQIFTPYVAWTIVLLVIAQIGTDGGLMLLSKLETAVRPKLQMRIFDLLMNQSLNFHANNFSGALVNQTNKFTSAYISLTDVFILNMLLTIVISAFAIIVTAFMLPFVALAMAVWTAFFVWLNLLLTKRRIHLSRIAAEADSVLTAHLADAVGNVAAIKSFGREQDEKRTHSTKTYDRAAKKYASWTRSTKNDFTFGISMIFLQVAVLIGSIVAVINGNVALGTLLVVQVYMTQLMGQLWGLSSMSRNIEQALTDAAEMTELLGVELEVRDPHNPVPLKLSKGQISFKNVNFTHDGDSEALFRDFNLSIKPGEKVGLVGHSGSGKTSLTKLLLRFSDIDSGQICLDDQNIATLAQADLRSHIAYVPQEPLLFHRSLRENIAYGKPDATDNQIQYAAKMAHADEFIKKLPKAYDTTVGERGVKLSGGQRQRIAIARAMLKDAPILVLDEATSALDSESERLIQSALWELMKGRTAIVIAHRLSTVQRMDRIVVLQDGRISEEGTHAELLAKHGVYASLWAHQSGGFLE